MSQLIVEANLQHVKQKNESLTEIPESIEKGYGVRQAFLMVKLGDVIERMKRRRVSLGHPT